MMVGVEDSGERQLPGVQELEDGRGIAGVCHEGRGFATRLEDDFGQGGNGGIC